MGKRPHELTELQRLRSEVPGLTATVDSLLWLLQMATNGVTDGTMLYPPGSIELQQFIRWMEPKVGSGAVVSEPAFLEVANFDKTKVRGGK